MTNTYAVLQKIILYGYGMSVVLHKSGNMKVTATSFPLALLRMGNTWQHPAGMKQ